MQGLVRSSGVGPQRVATDVGESDRTQQADRRNTVDEADIGVPTVRLAVPGIDRQYGILPTADGRMRGGRGAEQLGELVVHHVVHVVLVGEEEHFVLQQCGTQRGHHARREVTGNGHVIDEGADVATERADGDRCREGRRDGSGGVKRHGMSPDRRTPYEGCDTARLTLRSANRGTDVDQGRRSPMKSPQQSCWRVCRRPRSREVSAGNNNNASRPGHPYRRRTRVLCAWTSAFHPGHIRGSTSTSWDGLGGQGQPE